MMVYVPLLGYQFSVKRPTLGQQLREELFCWTDDVRYGVDGAGWTGG